jgi:hypothetical protein
MLILHRLGPGFCKPVAEAGSLAYKPGTSDPRRGARVADWGSLENCCARKCTVGSNPTLSATNST